MKPLKSSITISNQAQQAVKPLRYGCNPHQSAEFYFSKEGAPFQVLAGQPSYINIMDALLGWQLVQEARQTLNAPVAASFKHLSPAGVALATLSGATLSGATLSGATSPADANLSPIASAYRRARNGDPLSSYGDIVAVSHTVDETLAQLLKIEFSDGIIAPDYDPKALAVLKAKKEQRFLVLQAQPAWQPPKMESREIFGVTLCQQRNDTLLQAEQLKLVTTTSQPPQAIRDLLLALITVKYTQSNAVGIGWEGQMVGIGAGQQSRVDCILLAGKKAKLWRLRQHPLSQNLPFQATVPRQQRINACIDWLDDRITPANKSYWQSLFTTPPKNFTQFESDHHLKSWQDVCLASDGFLPFRDNIDQAARFAVSHIAQPGGSSRDQELIVACNQNNISMAFTGKRLFTH